MESKLKKHHIGIATKDLNKSIQKYINWGYQCCNQVFDSHQQADLVLLTKEGKPYIELVCAINEHSPVWKTCQTYENKEYHVCYQVKNLQTAIEQKKREKWLQVSEVVYAPLLMGYICFMYNREEGLIELYELCVSKYDR
ncbi:MAG: VOC family protein [Elusimicrobiaceae bacterium]|nr:VOC family protein [Elusimicrobiaceae bacterium]